MSLQPDPRFPRLADEDELALDRPGRYEWRSDPDDRDRRTVERIVVAEPAPRRSGVLDVIGRGIGLLARLTLLLILLAVLWGLVSMVGFGVQAPGAIGEQITGAIGRGASVVGAAGQRIADTFDPAHPPRQPLAQDVEIDELLRLNVGAQIEGSTSRVLTVASIQRRADPSGPDGAVYAVLHGELRKPRGTDVLGVTVRSTRDPQDYYLYKGETIRIGTKLYKVNWVSIERQQVALIAYRDQDRVSATLKAEID